MRHTGQTMRGDPIAGGVPPCAVNATPRKAVPLTSNVGPHMARRIHSPLVSLLVAAHVGGCATFSPDDSAVPGAGAAATLQCYWREYIVYSKECHITAVNGQRPTLRLWESGVFTASVPPGRQWIEIEMQAFAFGGGGTTDVCAFEHDFLPGVHYKIRPGSEAFEISATQKHNPALAPYHGSLVIESASTEQASQRVDLSCTHGGGSLCRSTGDCVKHPNVRCERREGEAFGKCAAGAGH